MENYTHKAFYESKGRATKPMEESDLDSLSSFGQSRKKSVLFDINNSEYGFLNQDKSFSGIYFAPSEFGILDNYSLIKEIYKV